MILRSPTLALAAILCTSAPVLAVEPEPAGVIQVAEIDPSLSQEQAHLDASCRQLRAQQNPDPTAATLDQQGPRHPRSTPVLSLGF